MDARFVRTLLLAMSIAASAASCATKPIARVATASSSASSLPPLPSSESAPDAAPIEDAGSEPTSTANVAIEPDLPRVVAGSPPLGDPFDHWAAEAALKRVKFDDCGTHTPQERFHLKITYVHTGKAKAVEIEPPLSGGDAVARCVRGRFAKVVVPPFAGYDVIVGKNASFGP